MGIKSGVISVGKLLVGGLAFITGSVLGSMLAGLLGVPLPALPAYIDPDQAARSLPLVGIIIAAVLAYFSKHSGVGFLPRWLVLGVFSWTAYGLNNYLEARYFSPETATVFLLVYSFAACFTCSAAVAWLFKPAPPVESIRSKTGAFISARTVRSWAWHFLVALAAFPVAYFLFGFMVSPFVITYYEQQFANLALPGMDVMLWLSILRSLLFLLSILPVLIAWQGRRTNLFLALGAALFIFVGALNMLQAAWLPVTLRVAHSLEILADSFVHAAALVFLLVPGSKAGSRIQTPAAELNPVEGHAL